MVKLALQVYATLLRGKPVHFLLNIHGKHLLVLSNDDRLRFFSRTYKFLVSISSIFPPLTQNSIYVLQQAIRTCSLVSSFSY